MPQADDGIEDHAGRAREGASVEGPWVLGTAPPTQEARAVGLPLHRSLRPAFEAQDVNRPRRGLVRGARPPMAEQGGALGKGLRLDKQLAEGGMGQIVSRRGEDDLGIARDFDLARTITVVGHGQPAHFDVVFGRYRDVELGRDVVIAPAEGSFLRDERDHIVLRLLRDGVKGGRPHRAAPHVAQVEELASRVTGRILAVPRDRAAPTKAGAPARVRHDGGVVAV